MIHTDTSNASEHSHRDLLIHSLALWLCYSVCLCECVSKFRFIIFFSLKNFADSTLVEIVWTKNTEFRANDWCVHSNYVSEKKNGCYIGWSIDCRLTQQLGVLSIRTTVGFVCSVLFSSCVTFAIYMKNIKFRIFSIHFRLSVEK